LRYFISEHKACVPVKSKTKIIQARVCSLTDYLTFIIAFLINVLFLKKEKNRLGNLQRSKVNKLENISI